MLRDLLLRPFRLNPNNYFISAISWRSVLIAVACFVVLYIVISPFFLAFYGHYFMRNLFVQGQLVHKIMQAGDGHKPQLYPVLDTHAMRGIHVKKNDSEAHYIWLGGHHNAADIEHDINLNAARPARPFALIGASARVMFGDAGKFVSIRHLGRVDNISVIALQHSIQQTLWHFFWRVSLFACLISMLMVVALRMMLTRQLLYSFDQLFVMFYGKRLGGGFDKLSVRDKNLRAAAESFQSRMQAHIDEQARLATLGAGAGRLAHDMRNLLTSLQLIADRLGMLKHETARKLSTRLEASVSQAVTLCEWAARYSSDKRDDADAVDLHAQPLAPIIDEMFTLVRFHDPQHVVELVNGCDSEMMVLAEKTLLFRVLYNLSLNAVQAMQSQRGKGFLRVNLRQAEDGCIIDIIDSGPGMPAENIDMLLDINSAMGRKKSIGLGVRIAHELVLWHKGSLELARSDASGTHFCIYLPAIDAQSAEASAKAA